MRSLVLFSVLALSACGGSTPTSPTEEGAAPAPANTAQRRDIDVAALKADLAKNEALVVVDVRTPEEFAEGHVPGALNIPLDELMERTSDLPEGDETYLICRSGGRSSRAADMLVASGHSAVNIKGGTLAWMAQEEAAH